MPGTYLYMYVQSKSVCTTARNETRESVRRDDIFVSRSNLETRVTIWIGIY